MPAMVDAICREIVLRQAYIVDEVTSIYFGGGTPSLLSVADIERILDLINAHFPVAKDVEITLEANPDDINHEKAVSWKKIGINRLSMGVQSFAEVDLEWMNRAHDATQAIASVQTVQQAGFDNITIDLIYGTPTLTDEQWAKNVETAIALHIPHLSCYALTVEEGTALAKMIRQRKKDNTDTEKQARHFEQLMRWMQDAGYDHYEISNFGKPDFHSRHNSSYWEGKHYLGIGPSAHSFNGNSRQWNVANNQKYLQAIGNGDIPFEIEILTPKQQLDEYIMTSLRTQKGLSLAHVSREWGRAQAERLEKEGQKFVQYGNAIIENGYLRLTDAGFLLADGIAADLFAD